MVNFKSFFAVLFVLGLYGCQPDDRLLLCAGNPDAAELAKDSPLDENGQPLPGFIYAEDNDGWFTVDKDSVMRPDRLADLCEAATYKQLPQNHYGIIIDEYCNFEASDVARVYAPKILKKGGILVSKVCSPYKDLKSIKHKMLQDGFSDVIFGNNSVMFTYELKKTDPQQIIKNFKLNEADKQSDSICVNGQWYPFVAIK